MITVRLPDGSEKHFDRPVTVADVAVSIGSGLAKAALAGRVNGEAVDLSYEIKDNADLVILTDRDKEAVDILRHSTAHLLAYAAKTLFPDAQVTIGPVIENGFYYDFSYSRPFTPDDVEAIEKKMVELAGKNETVTRQEMPRDEAIAYFHSIGEMYKAEIIGSIPEDETVTLYTTGTFTDLCRGPHVPSTGVLKVFKLMRVAGAYWRGDSDNEMLQRVYGTAWARKEDQDAWLLMLEEAERRDHRRLGRQLDLFHFQEEAPGLVFWHPKGWTIWQQVEQYMRQVYLDSGFQEVKSPMILDRSLWEKSGHWQNYQENMFTTESENRSYALKPMNCPAHVQIYMSRLHSYRELPLRFGEFGQCHRNEASGALHGLMRLRGFVQDDGHIFCTEEQILDECIAFTTLLKKVYADFGFTDIIYRMATRPEKRVGSDASWDKAEAALAASLDAVGVSYEIAEGEGAFYGPKIEYTLRDAIGRMWQCGTIQVDFSMPERLGAEYVTEENTRKVPVLLHRAILGSLERFIGILIENYAGAMPLWLAPVQVVVMNISEKQTDYAQKVTQMLKKEGLRTEIDLRNEKITFKIRDYATQRVPYIVVVGDKEKNEETVSVRARGNVDLGIMPVAALAERLKGEIAARK